MAHHTPTETIMETRKKSILRALRAFVAQRPGLDPRDYGSISAYRAESRRITRDMHHAETLLAAVSWRDNITADDIVAAANRAYSGRLSITEDTKGSVRVAYCTGQYQPAEYRCAVCAVLASALWNYARGNMPLCDAHKIHDGLCVDDWLRRFYRREFGRAIASRWFN